MDLKLRLYKKIEFAYSTGHEVAICPYGKNGMLAEKIITQGFHKKPIALIDNIKSTKSKKCINIKNIDINELKKKNTVVLLNASDESINKEYKEILKNKNIQVDDINSPSIYKEYGLEDINSDIYNLIIPQKANKYNYVRIGNKNDGGYIMLDDFVNIDAAYSFGISGDVSWDKDVAKKGIDVYMFDHTIDMPPEFNDRFYYSKIGVGIKDNTFCNIKSLNKILEDTRHINDNNLIMKMDIEGNEWDVINSISSEILMKFKQITIEFHGLSEKNKIKNKIKVLKKINKTHQSVWLHGNNFGYALKRDDVIYPNVVEITFARRKEYKFSKLRDLQLILDAPNNPDIIDFDIKKLKGKGI